MWGKSNLPQKSSTVLNQSLDPLLPNNSRIRPCQERVQHPLRGEQVLGRLSFVVIILVPVMQISLSQRQISVYVSFASDYDRSFV